MDIKEYSGWLQASISSENREKLETLARKTGLSVDIAEKYIEFEYQGRDTNRFVVRFLVKAAEFIGDAEGEIRCEIDSGSIDPEFEFYRFREGKLICQTGKIVRDIEIVVTL